MSFGGEVCPVAYLRHRHKMKGVELLQKFRKERLDAEMDLADLETRIEMLDAAIAYWDRVLGAGLVDVDAPGMEPPCGT